MRQLENTSAIKKKRFLLSRAGVDALSLETEQDFWWFCPLECGGSDARRLLKGRHRRWCRPCLACWGSQPGAPGVICEGHFMEKRWGYMRKERDPSLRRPIPLISPAPPLLQLQPQPLFDGSHMRHPRAGLPGGALSRLLTHRSHKW